MRSEHPGRSSTRRAGSNRILHSVLALSTCAAIAACNVSDAYYVSPSGDDRADGRTPGTAFRTIARAVAAVAPGGSVLILPGTYSESITIEDVGSAGRPITIRGEGGVPVLDGQARETFALWCHGCADLVFRDLEIRGYTDLGIGATLSAGITVLNLAVHHNGFAAQLVGWEMEGYGIHVDDSTGVRIEGCDVHENGPNPPIHPDRLLGTGINTWACRDTVIRNNRSHDNRGGGILVEDGVNVLVEGNEVRGNDLDATASGWWDGAIWIDGGHDVTVRNNVFRENLGPGIQVSDEDGQSPYNYVLENNVSTANIFGIYVWNFGTSDWPPPSVLRLSGNQIAGNTQQDVWIVP